MVITRDITEQKRMESSLKSERDRLVSILNSMTDGVYIVNQQYGIEYANPAMQREFGPFEGRECHEYLVGAGEPCSWCKWPEILAGKTVRVEWVCPRNGKVYDSIDTPLRNPDGGICKLKIIRDITERKQMERALHEAKENLESRVKERTADLKEAIDALQGEIAERREVEEKLTKTLASLTEAVFVVDPTTRTIISCNKAVEEIFGYSKNEVLGKNTEFLFPNRGLYEEFGRKLFPTLDSSGVFRSEHQMRRKDGAVFPSEHTVTEMVGESGRRTGVVSVVRDITERVVAERMLRESEARYRSLFEDSRDPVYVVTRDGTFVDFNQAMVDMFGYSRGELIDKNIRDLYANPDERSRFQRSIERRGAVRDYEIRFRRKNGRLMECLVTASLRRAEDGTILGYQGIIRDITRQRRYQGVLKNYAERLRALSQKLLDAQENERKLIARDLHDSIGGSLSAIKFSLARKLEHMSKGGSSGEILLENIISMVQRTIDENRRIMTELRPSLLDDLGILETIDWFCGEFEEVYPHFRIERHIAIEENEIPEPLKIVIFRILQEAMNNVAKHSKADFVRVYFGKADGSIEIAIQDNGQGLDAKRVIDQGKDRSMGLSSMRERAELFGGTFSLESKVRGGTTVRAKWEIKNNEK
jgi:PAS domain S-box-containing protein